jgi:hypothetical protein
MIDRKSLTSKKVVNFCFLQFKVVHPFVYCRKGIARIIITIYDIQSLLNFMGVGAFLPEKFDYIFLFDFAHIDIINIRNVDKCAMPAETSRISSMT